VQRGLVDDGVDRLAVLLGQARHADPGRAGLGGVGGGVVLAEDVGQAREQRLRLLVAVVVATQQLGTEDVQAPLHHPAGVGDPLLLLLALRPTTPQLLRVDVLEVLEIRVREDGVEPVLPHRLSRLCAPRNAAGPWYGCQPYRRAVVTAP
jgi:hypothetical protein